MIFNQHFKPNESLIIVQSQNKVVTINGEGKIDINFKT